MKVPVSWLREYVDFDLPVEELARQLVFTSCEVDRIVRRGVPGGGNLEHFLVGKVLEAGKHPNADKLQPDEGRRGRGRAALDRLRCLELRRRCDGRGRRCPGGVMPDGDSRSRSASCAARCPTG